MNCLHFLFLNENFVKFIINLLKQNNFGLSSGKQNMFLIISLLFFFCSLIFLKNEAKKKEKKIDKKLKIGNQIFDVIFIIFCNLLQFFKN